MNHSWLLTLARNFNLTKLKTFACLLSILLTLSACSDASRTTENHSSTNSTATPRPARIISLSPSVTEILYGINAFDRVVAVSDYCMYPPEAQKLPRVGGWINPNKERIASLRPDIVIGAGAQTPIFAGQLETLGLRVKGVPDQSLADVFQAIEEIGDATGNKAEANELVESTRRDIAAVRERVRGRPRPRVLFVADRLPGNLRGIYVATGGSFIVDLIEAAGGEWVAPASGAADRSYIEINKEALAAINPDIIIEIVQSSDGMFAEDSAKVWQEMPDLRAVRDGHIYTLRDASVVHPSQFVARTAQEFGRLIHPEVFGGMSK